MNHRTDHSERGDLCQGQRVTRGIKRWLPGASSSLKSNGRNDHDSHYPRQQICHGSIKTIDQLSEAMMKEQLFVLREYQ